MLYVLKNLKETCQCKLNYTPKGCTSVFQLMVANIHLEINIVKAVATCWSMHATLYNYTPFSNNSRHTFCETFFDIFQKKYNTRVNGGVIHLELRSNPPLRSQPQGKSVLLCRQSSINKSRLWVGFEYTIHSSHPGM